MVHFFQVTSLLILYLLKWTGDGLDVAVRFSSARRPWKMCFVKGNRLACQLHHNREGLPGTEMSYYMMEVFE